MDETEKLPQSHSVQIDLSEIFTGKQRMRERDRREAMADVSVAEWRRTYRPAPIPAEQWQAEMDKATNLRSENSRKSTLFFLGAGASWLAGIAVDTGVSFAMHMNYEHKHWYEWALSGVINAPALVGAVACAIKSTDHDNSSKMADHTIDLLYRTERI